jgi:hypothetical protein
LVLLVQIPAAYRPGPRIARIIHEKWSGASIRGPSSLENRVNFFVESSPSSINGKRTADVAGCMPSAMEIGKFDTTLPGLPSWSDDSCPSALRRLHILNVRGHFMSPPSSQLRSGTHAPVRSEEKCLPMLLSPPRTHSFQFNAQRNPLPLVMPHSCHHSSLHQTITLWGTFARFNAHSAGAIEAV